MLQCGLFRSNFALPIVVFSMNPDRGSLSWSVGRYQR
jgi:hypothetical protein